MKAWRPQRALALAASAFALLGAWACAAPTPAPRLAVGQAEAMGQGSLRLRIGQARQLQGLARAWLPSDVVRYRVGLREVEGERVASEGPTVEVDAKASPAREVAFSGLKATGRYEASVEAWGDEGGSEATLHLNTERPTQVRFDLGASGPTLSGELAVWLDSRPFELSFVLPSNAHQAGSVPAWCTGLDVALFEAGATAPLLRQDYGVAEPMRLKGLRGGVAYDLELGVKSSAGRRVMRLEALSVPKEAGQEQVVTPPLLPLRPPSGTLLNSYNVGSSFNLAIDANDHLWVANQHGNSVTEMVASGGAVLRVIPVGTQPRGVAVDPNSGQVWVTNFNSSNASRIVNGAVVGTHSAGFFPAGVAVDNAGRAFIANAAFGQVRALTATGGAVAGSPYSVGAGAAAIAIDRVLGHAWVSNANGASIHRISNGVVSGPFATGPSPGGLAVAPDGTLWVPCNGDSTLRRFRADGSASGANLTVNTGPSAVAINPRSGDLWVTLVGWNGLAKLNSAGVLQGAWAAGAFPAGIAIDSRDHVWVVGDGKVNEFAP